MAISRKTLSTFWQKLAEEKSEKKRMPPVTRRRERCESRVKTSDKKTINWAEKSGFWGSHRYSLTLYRGSCTSYILIDNELGDGEDIDRFVMPQGMFTLRISVIR